MNILVTGGAGYVGSTLCRLLLQAGHRVNCYDRLDHGATPIAPLLAHPRFALTAADIRHERLLKQALAKADAIIHLAAIVGAPACAKAGVEAEAVNVGGAMLIGRYRSPDQRTIFSSTGSIYGAVPNGLCTEATPPNPLSDYGRQKWLGEQFIIEKPNRVVFRLATVFGWSPRMRLDLLPHTLAYQALHDGRLELYEPHFQRTFVHVRDVARAFLFALECVGMTDDVFNLGTEQLNVSKLQLAEAIQRYVPVEIVPIEGKDVDARNYSVSYAKLRRTGFRCEVTLDEGIKEVVERLKTVEATPAMLNA